MFGIIGKTLGTSVALTLAMLFTPIPAYSQIIDDPGVYVPDQVKNVDVDALVEYIDRVAYELAFSESASLTDIAEYDYERIVAWSAKIREKFELFYNTKRSNWPHSRARMYTIKYTTTAIMEDQVINPGLRYAISYLAGMMSNLSRSQSADLSNGLLVEDYNIGIGGIDKFDVLLASYAPAGMTGDPQNSTFERGQNLGE